jgi:hypothetical protein
MIAAHRVERDLHLLLLFLFHHDRFAALHVRPAAVPADRVGENGMAAAIAVRILPRLEMLMAPPFALPGMGDPSLWNSHDRLPSGFVDRLCAAVQPSRRT